MTDLIMPRRKFLTGMFGLVAAPAVVKAVNIMPVKAFFDDGIPLNSPATLEYPAKLIRTGGVRLSEIRELLLPGLNKMFDDMYEDRGSQFDAIFRRVTE